MREPGDGVVNYKGKREVRGEWEITNTHTHTPATDGDFKRHLQERGTSDPHPVRLGGKQDLVAQRPASWHRH